MEITHLTGAHHRHLRALEVHSFRLPAEANFYHGQSFSINRPRQSSLFGHKLSPNEPFLALLAADSQKKKRVYKDAGPFFVTHSFCLPSTVEVFSPHTTSYRFQGTIHFHFLLTLTFSIYFMPSVQNTQTLPSFNLVHPPDHYTITIPNLSYPSRSNAHIAWTGSSAPLLFSKNTRPAMTPATSTNIQVPTTANICFDTFSVPDAFSGISVLIQHSLSVIVQKLKLIKQKLFGVRNTNLSVAATV